MGGIAASGSSMFNAGLADIAPTLLQLLNLPIPKEMTGTSLIKEVELKGYNKVVQHV